MRVQNTQDNSAAEAAAMASLAGMESVKHLAGTNRLSTDDRSIRAENLALIMRRWHLAQNGQPENPTVLDRWFPSQRNLMELLSVLDQEEAKQIADCGTPLFSLPRIAHINPADYIGVVTTGVWECGNDEEVYMALMSRLDALRTHRTNAVVNFDLAAAEAQAIAKLSPFELRAVARNPMMVMVPTASDQYFLAAATQALNPVQRTMLATSSRRAYSI